MKLKVIFILFVLSLRLFGLSKGVLAENRIALVIGNGAYSADPLSDPPNDAELIAKTLRTLGFDVVDRINVSQKNMKRLIRDFGKRIKAQKAEVGLFYYSGHGMQVEGRNYMIPIDAKIMDESDISIEGVGMDDVLTKMKYAGNASNIIILDACRDNPFEKRFKSAVVKGLRRMDAPAGALIAFAAQANKVALQGAGKYSYFTEALTREIVKPDISARDMLFNVRVAVYKKTDGRQVPVVEDQLLEKVYFNRSKRIISDALKPLPEKVGVDSLKQKDVQVGVDSLKQKDVWKDVAGNVKIIPMGATINARFVNDSQGNQRFVIHGKIKNDYDHPRSFIKITGKIYQKGGKLAKTETVYCGNVLSDSELTGMNIEAVNKRLHNRFGDKNSNLKVKTGQTIPFMIVFDKLPRNLDEYTVEVAGSSI